MQALLAQLKELENAGYQYEGAEASFELMMHRALNGHLRFFKLIGFRVIDENLQGERAAVLGGVGGRGSSSMAGARRPSPSETAR